MYIKFCEMKPLEQLFAHYTKKLRKTNNNCEQMFRLILIYQHQNGKSIR